MAKKASKARSVRLDPSDAVYVESIEGQRRTWLDTSSKHSESLKESVESQERVLDYLEAAQKQQKASEPQSQSGP